MVPNIGRKIKEGCSQALDKNQTKQDHYGPLAIILIRGTPLPSKRQDQNIAPFTFTK